MFTGREVKQGGVIISDAVVTQDALRYLRLIDKTGWVVDDSFVFLQLHVILSPSSSSFDGELEVVVV